MLNQPLQLFIGLDADHQIFSGQERRHGVDAEGGAAARLCMVGSVAEEAKVAGS
jgi:hypothetical protein